MRKLNPQPNYSNLPIRVTYLHLFANA